MNDNATAHRSGPRPIVPRRTRRNPNTVKGQTVVSCFSARPAGDGRTGTTTSQDEETRDGEDDPWTKHF
jgi:hypothetical protein